jgi:hypothetical protein
VRTLHCGLLGPTFFSSALEGVALSKVEMRAYRGDVDHSSRHCIANAFAPAAMTAARLMGRGLSLDARRERGGGALSCGFGVRVNRLVADDTNMRRYPVDADSEDATRSEKAGEDGVEGGEEVLAGLGFGGSECRDGWLTINEDVRFRQARRARDDVQRKDRPTDFGLKDGVLTVCAQVLLTVLSHYSVLHRYCCRQFNLVETGSNRIRQ